MSFFSRLFRRGKKPAAASARQGSLQSISYTIAYFVLPQNAFTQCEKVVSIFVEKPELAGTLFYLMGCSFEKAMPVEADGDRFRTHHGDLDAAHEYFVLEYPEPPPLDFSGFDFARPDPKKMPVLAPWFSAVVRHRGTGAVRYFNLGQSPAGGTTFRSVTADGTNSNLGPGPEPRLDDFLACVRERM